MTYTYKTADEAFNAGRNAAIFSKTVQKEWSHLMNAKPQWSNDSAHFAKILDGLDDTISINGCSLDEILKVLYYDVPNEYSNQGDKGEERIINVYLSSLNDVFYRKNYTYSSKPTYQYLYERDSITGKRSSLRAILKKYTLLNNDLEGYFMQNIWDQYKVSRYLIDSYNNLQRHVLTQNMHDPSYRCDLLFKCLKNIEEHIKLKENDSNLIKVHSEIFNRISEKHLKSNCQYTFDSIGEFAKKFGGFVASRIKVV